MRHLRGSVALNNLPEVTGTGVTRGGPAVPSCAGVPNNATYWLSQRANQTATPETDAPAVLPSALLPEALTGHTKNLILCVPASQSLLSLPLSRKDIRRESLPEQHWFPTCPEPNFCQQLSDKKVFLKASSFSLRLQSPPQVSAKLQQIHPLEIFHTGSILIRDGELIHTSNRSCRSAFSFRGDSHFTKSSPPPP